MRTESAIRIYGGQRIYFEGLLGIGKLWEHDAMHAWVERFRYVVLNGDGEWGSVWGIRLCKGRVIICLTLLFAH